MVRIRRTRRGCIGGGRLADDCATPSNFPTKLVDSCVGLFSRSVHRSQRYSVFNFTERNLRSWLPLANRVTHRIHSDLAGSAGRSFKSKVLVCPCVVGCLLDGGSATGCIFKNYIRQPWVG